MLEIIIATVALFLVSSLTLSAALFGASAFAAISRTVASNRNVKPFMATKTGKTPVGLQIALVLLLAAFVALGYVAVQ